LKKGAAIGLLAALVVLLAGCGDRPVTTIRKPGLDGPSTAALQTALAPVLGDRVTALYVAFGQMVDGGYASSVVFTTTAGCVYEGDLYATHVGAGWLIRELSFGALRRNVPLSGSEMSGRTANGRAYDIVSGVIGNKDIAYVVLTLADGSSVRVREEPLFHTYAFVQSVSVQQVRKVAGYSVNGTLIYDCPVEDVNENAYPTWEPV